MDPRVSIIISNRNDVSMLVVTVRSCIEELRPLGKGVGEIIICDNSDPPVYEMLGSALPTGYIREGLIKVFRQDFPCLFTARETAIKHAKGEYILCLDSHLIVGRDMIVDSVNFMDDRRDDKTLAFGHPPINWAHQHERMARHDRDMSECELGDWGKAYNYPRTITWKGMPWICRREWFLDKETGLGGYGALADHKLSWGGGDMHIGIKPWLLGLKNWAIPTSPAIHIGPFPKLDMTTNPNAVKVAKMTARDRYRLWAVSGEGPHALGFLVSCYILGGEPMMKRNRRAMINRFGDYIAVSKWWERAIKLGIGEKRWFDERRIMSFEQLILTKPWKANAS